MQERILVADDDDVILKFAVRKLEKEGYAVVTARRGDEAWYKWTEDLFDLIVLDIDMPGMTGIEVLRKIRESDNNIPIVMLTNHDEVIYEQSAIKYRADYWVPKHRQEVLLDWIKSKLQELRPSKKVFEDLRINFDAMQVDVKRDNKWEEQHLEPNERKLLFFLVKRAGHVQTYNILKRRVFNMHRDEEGLGGLRRTVSTLRKKIEPDGPADPTYIKTRTDEGYWFDGSGN